MYFSILAIVVLNCVLSSLAIDLYPDYNVSIDASEVQEWSDNTALSYVTTVRLSDYDHHVFQYRRYPCQYFYTDEIQLYKNAETSYQCVLNTTTKEYEYSFQLHLDSRHVEPYVLQNKAINCDYVKCSLSLLNITYLNVGWAFESREKNLGCSFDIEQAHYVNHTPYPITDWITLRCKSFLACNRSKTNIEEALHTHVEFVYGSSYELQIPYCSLEKSLSYVINTNFAETNRLLKRIMELSEESPQKRK